MRTAIANIICENIKIIFRHFVRIFRWISFRLRREIFASNHVADEGVELCLIVHSA